MSPQGAPRDQNEYKSPLRLYSVKFSLVFSMFLEGQSVQFMSVGQLCWASLKKPKCC